MKMNLVSRIKTAFLAVSMCILSLGAMSQGYAPTIKVSGEATVRANPEKLVVNIPVSAKNATYKACSDDLMSKFSSLKASLKKAGVDEKEVFSNGLRISEHYEYASGSRQMMGYEGNIQVVIRTKNDTKTLQAITEVLADDNYKFGYSLGYELSETQKEKLRDEAMLKAVQEATANATALAKGLDLSLGQVLEIKYEINDAQPGPWVRSYAMKAESGMANDSIELNPEEQLLTKRVEVVWSLKAKQ